MSVRSGLGIRRNTYHESPFRRKDRPRVWAHRGASADAPENTRAAFEAAEQQGADGIECDLRLARSGEIVVFHDEDLGRLAGVPVALRDLPLSELRRLRILGSEETIPTLDEAFAAVSARMFWNLELKVDRHEEAVPLAQAVVDWVRRAGVGRRVLLSSFHPLALLTCRKLAPELATAYLWEAGAFHPLWHGAWLRMLSSAAVHPPTSVVTERRVERWHRLGLCVNAWVSNEAEEMRRLDAAGVDGIVTDLPSLALQALGAS